MQASNCGVLSSCFKSKLLRFVAIFCFLSERMLTWCSTRSAMWALQFSLKAFFLFGFVLLVLFFLYLSFFFLLFSFVRSQFSFFLSIFSLLYSLFSHNLSFLIFLILYIILRIFVILFHLFLRLYNTFFFFLSCHPTPPFKKKKDSLVDWDSRIHRLLLCREVRPSPHHH